MGRMDSMQHGISNMDILILPLACVTEGADVCCGF